MKIVVLLSIAIALPCQLEALGCAFSAMCYPKRDAKWLAFKRVHRKAYLDLEDEMTRYHIYLRNLCRVSVILLNSNEFPSRTFYILQAYMQRLF